jgi:hypothetical protein
MEGNQSIIRKGRLARFEQDARINVPMDAGAPGTPGEKMLMMGKVLREMLQCPTSLGPVAPGKQKHNKSP